LPYIYNSVSIWDPLFALSRAVEFLHCDAKSLSSKHFLRLGNYSCAIFKWVWNVPGLVECSRM